MGFPGSCGIALIPCTRVCLSPAPSSPKSRKQIQLLESFGANFRPVTSTWCLVAVATLQSSPPKSLSEFPARETLVWSRKTSCLWFSSNLIQAMVPNCANTKNSEGNRNYSYLALISPILGTSVFLAEVWTTLTVPLCLAPAAGLVLSSLRSWWHRGTNTVNTFSLNVQQLQSEHPRTCQ